MKLSMTKAQAKKILLEKSKKDFQKKILNLSKEVFKKNKEVYERLKDA